MRYVFWWDSPCKGMIGVLREFCKIAPDTVVYTGPTGKGRIAMGWAEESSLFEQHKIISFTPDEHVSILQQHLGDFHIVNGLVRPYFRCLLNNIIEKNVQYATMTEAPCNMFSGFRKFEKKVFQRFVQPIRHKKFAQTISAFISLSGGKPEDIRNIMALGFPKEKIYPFGYFTDISPDFRYEAAKDGKIHLLCPGLLEKYKGVDILVKAIKQVRAKGITNFHCHITGNGREQRSIEQLINRYNLNDLITLHGALDEKNYSELLKKIDILVAPGRTEPWGIRVNEAIQRGQAVIVSNHIGASVLIDDSKGGIVFESGSINDLSDAITTLITNSNQLEKAKSNNLSYRNNISCAQKARELYDFLETLQKKQIL